jgi:hypothetical protein
LRIKTIPRAVAIESESDFSTGATAEIALPPQIDVPEIMSSERGEGILKIFAKEYPIKKTREILTKVTRRP